MTAKRQTRTKVGKAALSLVAPPPLTNALDKASLALGLTFTGVAP